MEHILSLLGNWVKFVIATGGYTGVFVLMTLESACIPLPSEVTMTFAGALTVTAFATPHTPMNFWLVVLAGALGESMGSSLAWWVGATGGRELVLRYGKYVLLKRRDVERSEAWFQRRGPVTVFIARLLPVVRTFISLPAGIARMPFLPFLGLSFLGSVTWCYLLAYIGVQFYHHLDDLKRYFHGADTVIGVAVAALFGLWLWHHLRPEHAEVATAEDSTAA